MDAADTAQIEKMIKTEVNHHEDIDILRFEEANKSINHMNDKIKDATALLVQHSLKLQEFFDTLKHQDTLKQEQRIRELENFKNNFRGRVSGIVVIVTLAGSFLANWVADFFKGGK